MNVQDLMTRNVVTMPRNAPVSDAARAMKTSDIGTVIVEEDGGKLFGVVTDRDIVVRAIAEDCDPHRTQVGDICSKSLVTLKPTDSVDEAVRRMKENAVRRLPVVDDKEKPIGIVSLGDLAMERDPDSALGQVSLAPPNA